MVISDERNRSMKFRGRLTFILVFGMVFAGILCWSDATRAAAAPFQENKLFFDAGVENHELIRMARLDQDHAKANISDGGVSTDGKSSEAPDEAEDWPGDEAPEKSLFPDPLEPMNRAFFEFNDKAYFWFFKPVAEGYSTVMPDVLRLSLRNFFTNLSMPIRLISCLLQGKIKGVGITLVRFVVNSSAGFLGFQDVAKVALDYPVQDEDLGQVFAFYGIGPGFYLNLPFLGASSLRDTAGWVGGLYLNPWDYIVEDFWPNIGGRAFDMVNKTSLRIGEYEALKDAALDPYVAMRDAYYQYRLNQIEK